MKEKLHSSITIVNLASIKDFYHTHLKKLPLVTKSNERVTININCSRCETN